MLQIPPDCNYFIHLAHLMNLVSEKMCQCAKRHYRDVFFHFLSRKDWEEQLNFCQIKVCVNSAAQNVEQSIQK